MGGDRPRGVGIGTTERVTRAGADQVAEISYPAGNARRCADGRYVERDLDQSGVCRIIEGTLTSTAVDKAGHGTGGHHFEHVVAAKGGKILHALEIYAAKLRRLRHDAIGARVPSSRREPDRRAIQGRAELERVVVDDGHVVTPARCKTALVVGEIAEVFDIVAVVEAVAEEDSDRVSGRIDDGRLIEDRLSADCGRDSAGIAIGKSPAVCSARPVERVYGRAADDLVDTVVSDSDGDSHGSRHR